MYSNAKIYKIIDIGYNDCYYGSTCQPLSKRIGDHKKNYKCYKDDKYGFITSFILFDKYGLENCKIELVENYECKTKEELRQREGWYIKNNDCVNKRIPGRTQKEYYEDNKDNKKDNMKEYYEKNKDKIKELKKDYYEKSKDKIKEYRKQRINCDICGLELNKSSLYSHKKNMHK